ncbi:MAG: M50 family metallopeptidase, partial [bacterium]|nr:M50 family metallopeptidase [bacterium]
MFVLQFVVILILLVIIHEFGHFIAAKKSGVRVEEFGVGLPPRLFGKKFGKKPADGEDDDRTLYSINALPIGGFVRLAGEDAIYVDKDDPKNLNNAPLWKRMIIVTAGVFMNFILGMALFTIVYSYTGIPNDPHVTFKEVSDNSPALEAGVLPNDRVYSVAGQLITNSAQLHQIIKKNLEKKTEIVVIRDNDKLKFVMTPRSKPPEGQGSLGVILNQKVDYKHYPAHIMPFHAIAAGFKDTTDLAQQIVPALGDLFTKIVFEREVPEGVAGPVGISKVSKAFCESGPLACMQFAGLLSINLAVFNLLPFPALDGGR